MGICGSAESAHKSGASPEELARDKAIAKELGQAESQDKEIKKLLLLGAGASGKSTLFKQMNSIYGKGFSDAERREYISIIHQNVLSSMKLLVENCPTYSPEQGINPELTNAPIHESLMGEVKDSSVVDINLGHHISLLWQDEAIQRTYIHGDKFQLNDSAKYFFTDLDRISSAAYTPTEQDVLRSRAPTTGIVENHFIIEGSEFAMFDVGGQRNERKKWIHCFENVTAVLFVAALSEYSMMLYEDNTQNRLVESLALFKEICATKFLSNTAMLLFLNKRDLFAEKISTHPISQYFPEYTGDNTYEAGVEWIQSEFEKRNANPDRTIYVHVTCATDTSNVKAVFEAVKDIVLRDNINHAFGL